MLAEDFKRLELKQLIRKIGQLPINPPYLLDSFNEKHVFFKYKESSAILELWLRKLILFESAFSSSTEEDFIFFKPLAEFYRTLLDLCLELQMRNPVIFSDPYMTWFLAVTSEVQKNLDSSLLAGDLSSPSKGEKVKQDRQLINDFEALSVAEEGELTIQKIVLLEAQKFARNDDGFYKSTWKPFLSAWRKYLRAMERCKNLEIFCLLPDGRLFITGSKRKLPPEIKSIKSKTRKCNGIVTKNDYHLQNEDFKKLAIE